MRRRGSGTPRRRARPLALALAAALLALAASACDTKFYAALGEKVSVAPLAISPAAATVPASGAITFTASGGSAPYTYSMVSGLGTVNASTGAYLASGTAGTEYVQVKDSKGATSRATVTVVSTAGPLAITPATVSLNAGGTITFVASGGTPPYTFSISSAGSAPPAPAVGSSTGAYSAGSNPGTDTVKVTDSAAATATATVTVTAATSTVDYAIPTETLPAGGTGATALGGGYSFTIQNVGTGNGTQPVSWWVFVSPTPAPGSGTVLLESGTAPAAAAGGSAAIPLSWTWPSVPPVLPGPTRYLYVMISAADDLTTANNTYAASGFTLAPPDVNYTVASVGSTGGTQAGGPLAGSFTLQNSGTAGGGQSVGWTAYVSTDSTATIDAGAVPLGSGTTAALGAGGTQAVAFSGTWPSAAGTWYLKAAVSASDEVSTTDDVQVSGPITTTIVDYAPSAVTNTGGLVGGAPMAGSFTLTNTGSANGSQTVSWSVYISTTSTLGVGSTLAASGTRAALPASQSAPVTFSGAWPAAGGSYYLIASVSASDDPNAANNQAASGVLSVTSTNVDYASSAVTSTGGQVSGSAMAGNFTLTNSGSGNGAQAVSWAVYISTTPTAGPGSTLAASGTTAALTSGQSTPVGFAGNWPAAAATYYLVAVVTASDDSSTANNQATSAALTVNPASVDYKVLSVALTGGASDPAAAIGGTLQFSNVGTDNGTQYVTWQVFASHDTVLDSADMLIASGANPPLASGGSSPVIPFSGNWPLTYGPYYLLAKVSVSADVDINPANNVAASASATTIGEYVDTEPNNDTNLVTVQVLPVTLKPGMSIMITGNLNHNVVPNDPWDVFQFNTGTAGSVTFSMTWASSATVYLYLLTAPATFATSVNTIGTSLSLPWSPVDLPNTNRWIGLNDQSGLLVSPGNYTLVINAN